MPTSSLFIIGLSLLSFLSLPSPSLSETCNPNDKKALLKIKKALNDPYILNSWDPKTDCCNWYVVDCDPKTHRITQLHLFAANVPGQIPEAISELPHLEFLMFHKLNLTGQIPSSITKLTNLKLLDLSLNHLSGPIPSFLTQLKNLAFLDLSFNNFTGSIPPSFSEFQYLDALHLDRNGLAGSIPVSFGKFTGQVPDLFLSHNQLTGEVPRSLGDLNFTTQLDFSRNKLQGDVSFLFGTNKSVQIVDLSRNMFEFDLSKVEFPESLTSLDLNHNRITGSLPEGLAKLSLQYLNVSYNRLCGEIPTGGRLQNMDYTSYFHNRCNPDDKKILLKIKEAFNNPYHLASWDPNTDCCYWYVVECDRKTNRINNLHLFAANVSGQIPESISELPYLESLTFHKITNLTGTIPRSLTRLTHLKSLRISWTNISGSVPSFLSELKNLTFLDLSFNNFSGSIPPSLANLKNLDGLRLDRNKLTGAIPQSFGDLSASLQYLYLSHNQLSGTIPRAWGDLNFTSIELQRNRIEGDISFLFGKNKTIQIADFSRNMLQFDISNVEFPDSLTTLDLNHNRITGSLPDNLARLDSLSLNVSYNRLCGRIPVGGRLQTLDYTSYFHNRCLCGAPLPDCK
ncbi:hypothetical protein BUALT_Bualt14G0107400 [Buddleja alternifolia]|uniref:Leucine-rich repeat-containing N-terminal plant-type domain-containing protein n=1 Tax=Buddleja alternifolia TaxID=168488 RepID=A0AAV6WGT2_9LAMI|nr:hypothetical protein BUALT_Bualt14G0107400 [Buddleja alternifolia]